MSLDPDVIEEIAAELGIEAAFVEKDWYSVQVLKKIAEHSCDNITTIFSGGTSLSMGHGLIQRFSEDLDFRCRYS
jgi:predicted nucleotidyltransferase component of viral defense system